MLNQAERRRYDRQILIYGFGEEGQEKLKRARVFIAGAGGLGSPIAMYLAAAGVGRVRIVDNDKVDLSNLNRQLLHWTENTGQLKTESAREKLQRLNPDVTIEALCQTIDEGTADDLVGDADCIVDAMDNLPTRYLLNKTAVEKRIPYFHGAVYGLDGRAMTVLPGKSACLYCLYHGVLPPKEKFPILGATAGVIGCIQASEVIKYFTGMGELLTGRLLNYDGLNMKFSEFRINLDPKCSHCAEAQKNQRQEQ